MKGEQCNSGVRHRLLVIVLLYLADVLCALPDLLRTAKYLGKKLLLQ